MTTNTALATHQSDADLIGRINAQLATEKAGGSHVLAPLTIQAVPPMHRPVVVMVHIDHDPNHKEVYPQKGGGLSLSALGLKKIAGALGIRWLQKECRRQDDGRDPGYCAYRMVGIVQELDGTWRTLMGDKEIRIDTVIEELRDNYREKSERYLADEKDGPEFRKAFPTPDAIATWVREKVRVDALQIKKHLLARAQTGAMARAIKSLGIRETYTPAELAKPFVFPKLVFEPDPNHPQDRAFLLASSSGAIEHLYPAAPTTPVQSGLSALPPGGGDHEDAVIYDLPDQPDHGAKAEAVAATLTGGVVPPPVPTAPAEFSVSDSLLADFGGLDAGEQERTLAALARTKGYKGKIAGPIRSWAASARLAFFQRLSAMPTVSGPSLPFE